MDNPGRVDRLQGFGQTRAQSEYWLRRPGAVPRDRLAQRNTWYVYDGQPGGGGVRVGVDHARGEGTVDPPGGGDLAGEAAPEVGVPGQLRTYHLHRDQTPAG